MIQTTVTLPFTPRPWQVPLIENAFPRMVGVVHRQAGKTTALAWRGLRKALLHDRRHLPPARRNLHAAPPRVVHVLPLQVTWKKTGLWDAIEAAARAFPGAKVMKSEFRVIMPNRGVYQVGGMDNPDNWRGGYADEIIEDEADDALASGIDMVIEPMLLTYDGARCKIGTPKGNGRLATAYNESPPEQRFLLPWQATGVFTAEEVARRRESPSNPDGLDEEEFAQEMECSFTSPNSGSYYGKWLDAAVREDRIRKIAYDPRLPVFTGWDLGLDDSTAIWWFQRSPGGEWRWLKYHEDAGPGLDTYAKLLHEQPYVYGRHFLPHDIEVREQTYQGRSRRHYLDSLNVRPIKVVPAANPSDRISAVRQILPRSFFDADGCAVGLKALRGYRRQWNEMMGVWRSEPVHDWASHGADGLGTGVQGSQDPDNEKPKIGPYVPRPALPPSPGGWMRR